MDARQRPDEDPGVAWQNSPTILKTWSRVDAVAAEVDALKLSSKNHSATLISPSRVLVFGGFDGDLNNALVRVLDISTGQWSMPETRGEAPAPRNGHTACVAAGKLWIIGGWLGQGELGSADVFTLDLVSMSWTRLETLGRGPGPCNLHTANVLQVRGKEQIFLFQGGDGRHYLANLFVLDCQSLVWSEPKVTGDPPPQRAYHASCSAGSKLYIFGGWNGSRRLNDLCALDVEAMTWTSPLITTGMAPSPRAGTTMVVYNNRLILFGGAGPHSECYNSTHVLDLDTLEWQDVIIGTSSGRNPNEEEVDPSSLQGKIVIRGQAPEERAGHTGTLAGRFFVVIGGARGLDYHTAVHLLDLDTDPSSLWPVSSRASALLGHLSRYLFSSQLADIVLETADGKRFFAHKLCLTQSPTFEAMLGTKNFVESTQTQVRLPDMSSPTLRVVLTFLYKASVDLRELDFNECIDVLVQADKLQVDGLKDAVQMHMAKNLLTVETLSVLQGLVKSLSLPLLQPCVAHFMRVHGSM